MTDHNFITIFFANNYPDLSLTWYQVLDPTELDQFSPDLPITLNSSGFRVSLYTNGLHRNITKTFTFTPQHFNTLTIFDLPKPKNWTPKRKKLTSIDALLDNTDKAGLKYVMGEEIQASLYNPSFARASTITPLIPIHPKDFGEELLFASPDTFYKLRLVYKDRIAHRFIGFDYNKLN